MQQYWTVSEGNSVRRWTCRECRKDIHIGDHIIVRDGRKIRLAYHPECFSGDADPRTQKSSSYYDPRWPDTCFRDHAPEFKGHGKWSVISYGYQPISAPVLGSSSVKSLKHLNQSDFHHRASIPSSSAIGPLQSVEQRLSSTSKTKLRHLSEPNNLNAKSAPRPDIQWGFARKEVDNVPKTSNRQ
ncbi:hypothetical protein QVD99_000794 [Batrachochytrium dendrobatidis]|nr:hypothetical protein QVD99_000794 [Batrachochytrium dendrobatidis]